MGSFRYRLVETMLPVGAIDRALAQTIYDHAAPLVVLEAPAGYGKSTILMQVRDLALVASLSVVWLSLDDTSENEVSFLSALVRATAKLELDLGALQKQATRGFAEMSIRQAIAAFSDAIALSGRHICFFIDNLDEATEVVVPIIATLASRLAPHCRFVVATRFHASAGLVAAKAAGRVAIFGTADLKLTSEEGREILKQFADKDFADTIIDWTEGWPVMIQLVKLAMERSGIGVFKNSEKGIVLGDLAEYLAEQVLQNLPAETQKDLLYLSVCERFNGDTLNALRDRHDGMDVLADYVQKGLLLVPLDGELTWYRFHSVFGEFLRGRLQRSDSCATARIHGQAAGWFAKQGLLNDAIKHANAAGDIALTTKLLADAGGWLVAFRGGTKALRIIASLPDDVLEAHPYLRLGQIYLLARESRLKDARSAFNKLMTQVRTNSSFDSDEDTQIFNVSAGALDALLCIYEVKRLEPEGLLQLQAQCGPKISKKLAAMITHLLGYAYYCDGNYPRAKLVCTTASEQSEAAGAAFIGAYSNMALGDTYLEMAELEAAERCFNAARLVAVHNMGSDADLVKAADIFLAEVAYERNDLAVADSLLKKSLAGIERRDPWLSVYTSGHRVAAEIAKRKGGWKAGIEFLEAALTRLYNHELRSVYTNYLHVGMSEIFASAGLLDRAHRMLRESALHREADSQQRSRPNLLRMLATTRLMLVQGNGEVALQKLERLLPYLIEGNQQRRILKVHVFKAYALHLLKRSEDAGQEIDAAVRLAVKTGMVAPLIEERIFLERILKASGKRLEGLPGIDVLITTSPFEHVVMNEPCALAISEIPHEKSDHENAKPRLSKREQEVLALLAEGLSGKEIAIKIKLSLNTVMGYRKSLYRKLDVGSRSGVISEGKSQGYI